MEWRRGQCLARNWETNPIFSRKIKIFRSLCLDRLIKHTSKYLCWIQKTSLEDLIQTTENCLLFRAMDVYINTSQDLGRIYSTHHLSVEDFIGADCASLHETFFKEFDECIKPRYAGTRSQIYFCDELRSPLPVAFTFKRRIEWFQ